jgi:hypothetical protein
MNLPAPLSPVRRKISSIHISSIQREILSFLLDMDFNLRGCLFVLNYYQPNTIEEALDQILSDETGNYHHPFISLDEMNKETCIICNS